MMRLVKKIIIYILFLIVLSVFGTIIISFFDKLFKLGYEDIMQSGFKVGLVAWLGIIALDIYNYYKK